MFDNSLLEALTASLTGQVSTFFDDINASGPQPIARFDTSRIGSVYVLYSATGLPLSVGVIGDGPRKRGRQAPPQDVARVREAVPNAVYCSVDVGDSALAESLARLIQQLFSTVLPMNGRVSAGATIGAGKRRGRPPGSGAKAGRKRGRPAKVAANGLRRGPGRPRKIQAENGVVKRGPGRPRKNPEGVAAAPKRRGRPKGSKNKPKAVA